MFNGGQFPALSIHLIDTKHLDALDLVINLLQVHPNHINNDHDS